MLEALQKVSIQGKELGFSQVLYVNAEILIALPLHGTSIGLFYRNGRASLQSVTSALQKTGLQLTDTVPCTYKGIKYLELGGNNGESDESKASRLQLQGRPRGKNLQGRLLRSLERLTSREDVSAGKETPEAT